MFLNHIYRHAREDPDHLAIVNSGEEISYCRFAKTIEMVRNHLMRARLPRDGVVVNITSNLYHDWVLLLALRSLGLTTVSGASWKTLENLDLVNVTALVCVAGHSEAMKSFASARPDCVVIEFPRQTFNAAHQGSPPPPIDDGPFGDHILYTSGTTGTYKKLRMDGSRIDIDAANDPNEPASRSRSKTDVYYSHNFGPWTRAGYRQPITYWFHGGSVIFDQRKDWAEHFFDYPATKASMVPPLLEQLCRRAGPKPAGYPSCQVRTGGGFLDAELALRAIRQFGFALFVTYGGTEFKGALESQIRTEDDVVWLTPLIEGRFEIVDDRDRQVPIGTEGILRVRQTPADPTEYLDDPEPTAKHFRSGFFYPGDLAVQRDDGRIRILGRVDEVLNLGGEKIAIQPFEDWVRKTLGVERICAFNQQTEDGKDILIVAIEGSRLPERARLQTMSRQLKQVPQIRISLINRFPRGENGMMKVNRRKVLQMVREALKEGEGAAG